MEEPDAVPELAASRREEPGDDSSDGGSVKSSADSVASSGSGDSGRRPEEAGDELEVASLASDGGELADRDALLFPPHESDETFASLRAPSAVATASFCDAFLGDAGCVRVCERARMSEHLVQLDLRGNDIGLEGARAIGDMLRVNRSLEWLSLEWNNVGAVDAGCRALASALEANNTLTELDLRNNSIGSEGAASLARSLARNVGLKVLDLRWNEVGAVGGKAFATALSDVDADAAAPGSSSSGRMSRSRFGNRSLRDLKLSGNGASEESLREIEAALIRNRHPGAQLALGEARLADLASRLRLAGDAAAARPSLSKRRAARKARKPAAAQLGRTTVEEGKADEQDADEEEDEDWFGLDELERAYEQQDSIVFADRVVELEAELKGSSDAIRSAQKETADERAKRLDAETAASSLRQQLATAAEAATRLEAEAEAAREAAASAAQAARAAQAEQARLRGEADKLHAELETGARELTEAREAARLEAALREPVAEQLEAERRERRELAERLEQAGAHAAEHKEHTLRAELAAQRALDAQREELVAQQTALEARLQSEVAARAADAREAADKLQASRQELRAASAALEQRLQDEAAAAGEQARAAADDLVQQTKADLEAERESWRAELEAVRQKASADAHAAAERHAAEIRELKTAHQRRVQDAVAQAVESELERAVKAAVADAAKELEEEHKRDLWRAEREITERLKADGASKLAFLKDKAAEDQRALEQQRDKANARILELQAQHTAQIASLKERMRQAVAETFV